jgi:hypothetical protein
LRPGEPALVEGEVVEDGSLHLRVGSGGEDKVTATVVLQPSDGG